MVIIGGLYIIREVADKYLLAKEPGIKIQFDNFVSYLISVAQGTNISPPPAQTIAKEEKTE